jgi:hypothetical protein
MFVWSVATRLLSLPPIFLCVLTVLLRVLAILLRGTTVTDRVVAISA